jgi:hypothetical protein
MRTKLPSLQGKREKQQSEALSQRTISGKRGLKRNRSKDKANNVTQKSAGADDAAFIGGKTQFGKL